MNAGERGLDWNLVTGGTDPPAAVHPEVVATMGCSTLELDADTEVRDWALPDPDGESPERVREIREEVRERVTGLFDDLTGET